MRSFDFLSVLLPMLPDICRGVAASGSACTDQLDLTNPRSWGAQTLEEAQENRRKDVDQIGYETMFGYCEPFLSPLYLILVPNEDDCIKFGKKKITDLVSQLIQA